MASNRDRAAEIIYRTLNPKYGDFIHHEETADALAAAGLLAPELIPLEEGDHIEVLDALLNARQSANIFGSRHQATAWEVASLLFDAHTTATHAQKEETNE